MGDRNEGRHKLLSPPRGVGLTAPPSFGGGELAVPHEVKDAATGVVQGDALRKIRSERPPEERLDKLDDFRDEMTADRNRLLALVMKMAEARGQSNINITEAGAASKRTMAEKLVFAIAGLITAAGTAYVGYLIGRAHL